MLKLSNITKQYTLGGNTIDALRGIDLEFRENEFVSILGPSGCGKTTTLNIIGGLDRYTSGDLIINGRSTKEYKDSDWDAYRNHSIGFVFQSYNLIPHQTVLANVELALTLAGVSRAERRRRAIEALERVGLGDQLNKVPSQMSGGQMQRVAIARALINDPDILLADEPTGALDSETSVQVMELLKEVAQDRLVIMVTHNPELAQQYSTRIVNLKDGKVTGDSNPYHSEDAAPVLTGKQARGAHKTSMSFLTALSLSLTNLRTKMGRTVLTAFAGSIGIIGIALILALSTGINDYINKVQEDTLSSYPITIQAESTDMSALMASMMGTRREQITGEGKEDHDPDRVYGSTVMYDMMDSMLNAEVETNNLQAFKEYLDNGGGGIKDMAAIQYNYDFDFDIYTQDENGDIIKCDVMTLMQDAMTAMYGGDYSSYF
ncbi:MAG: ABC transporter ATP-binding protein, partial [Clostridiales bacterium]|nr:ABC transporter ATP-binding protein [Clostridiales bacterium]